MGPPPASTGEPLADSSRHRSGAGGHARTQPLHRNLREGVLSPCWPARPPRPRADRHDRSMGVPQRPGGDQVRADPRPDRGDVAGRPHGAAQPRSIRRTISRVSGSRLAGERRYRRRHGPASKTIASTAKPPARAAAGGLALSEPLARAPSSSVRSVVERDPLGQFGAGSGSSLRRRESRASEAPLRSGHSPTGGSPGRAGG